jgi:hypothetical protein
MVNYDWTKMGGPRVTISMTFWLFHKGVLLGDGRLVLGIPESYSLALYIKKNTGEVIRIS